MTALISGSLAARPLWVGDPQRWWPVGTLWDNIHTRKLSSSLATIKSPSYDMSYKINRRVKYVQNINEKNDMMRANFLMRNFLFYLEIQEFCSFKFKSIIEVRNTENVTFVIHCENNYCFKTLYLYNSQIYYFLWTLKCSRASFWYAAKRDGYFFRIIRHVFKNTRVGKMLESFMSIYHKLIIMITTVDLIHPQSINCEKNVWLVRTRLGDKDVSNALETQPHHVLQPNQHNWSILGKHLWTDATVNLCAWWASKCLFKIWRLSGSVKW